MPLWLADRGQTLDRESVGVRLPSGLTRRLGNAMRTSQIKAQEGEGVPDAHLRPTTSSVWPRVYRRKVQDLDRVRNKPRL